MMSNLPYDLAEEVLCRIPLTSLRSVRFTCKKWNTLSKSRSFVKKHRRRQAKVAEAKDFVVVVMMDFKVYLMRVNLYENVESCIKREGKLISSDPIDVYQVFHCDGLLLCITEDNTRLMVWNPYWGHVRWIEPTHNFNRLDMYSYALGYDKSSKSHKILRFIDYYLDPTFFVEFKVYDLNSDSWSLLDLPERDWRIEYYHRGVTLKGNTYWFATEKYIETRDYEESFLVCFDFTSERFGPRLPLPFDDVCLSDTVSLSIVREEQLAVLFQPWDTLQMEIWVTSKIEPNAVSWNSKVFLAVNIKEIIHPQFQIAISVSFFIDEEKKEAVLFDRSSDSPKPTRRVAYIIGVDGSLKQSDLGESAYLHCEPLVCSYVSSLVQLN